MRVFIIISCLFLLTSLPLSQSKGLEQSLRDFKNDTIDQLIDHDSALSNATFKQRFFYNDTYWDPQYGPIFLYICGESTCRPPTDRGYPFQLCVEMKCLFYVLEHRYYGASQPFGNWSVESLKYLNSTQALADLDYFIKLKNLELQEKYGSGLRKWLTIGGSYPGALSAWFKSKYPTSAVAAWSSSGVIHAIEDFTDYDLDIYQATARSGLSCPQVISNITQYVEQSIVGNLTTNDSDYVYSIFGGKDLDAADFMNYFADMFAGSIQYGSRTSLCNILNSIVGVAVKDQLPVIKQYGDSQGLSINDYYLTELQNETIDINKNGRQWTWQICTEFGWFQTPNPVFPMRSSLINITYWLNYCKQVFKSENMTAPAVDFYNSYYGGLNIQGSNIIYMNAAEDPWQYAGMRKIQDPVTQSGQVAVYIDCNNCAHCVDLKTPKDADSPALSLARKKIKNNVTKWLTPTQEEIDKVKKDHQNDTMSDPMFTEQMVFLQ